MARKHRVKTRPSSWVRRGFLPEEAYYLSEISREGAKAPYILAMRRRRSSLKANATKYGWTKTEYRRRVIADYIKLGMPDKKRLSVRSYINEYFYDYFTVYKDRTPKDPEYESPRNKRRKVTKVSRPTTSRAKMLRNKIDELNTKISRASLTGNQRLLRELEKERNITQNKYDRLA